MNTSSAFYDQLTPFYHLLFPDWETSIRRQAAALDGIIREYLGEQAQTVLDVACGIGTQALGLAALGYTLTASDLSREAVERARREAQARGLHLDLSVADMREAYTHHQREFDVVMACDNALPHLLTDEELLRAFQQFHLCTRPGGLCLISVRDYDKEERSGVQVRPYGVRVERGTRYLLFQVWEFDGPFYDLAMYFIEDRGGSDVETRVMRSKDSAVGTDRLMALMREAGFRDVQRLDDRFYQPVIIGKREAHSSS